MRILAVNWLDLENPQAGGAEVHFFELFGRLARWGHDITLVTSGWRGAAPRATIRGLAVQRVAGRYSFALRGRGAVRKALRERAYDVVVEDINKAPLYLASVTKLPLYVIVPHLFGATAFLEAPWPVALGVWLAERPIPKRYREAAFHAISESTRDDLVARGVPPDRVQVILPGVDADWFTPDPATPLDQPPTFLYIGRLKRYKGLETALRALALARTAGHDFRLAIAGGGDDRGRLERVARRLGLGEAAQFLGFVDETEKRDLLRRAWATVFPSAKEGWGITNVEAAACGTPAIAADRPGLRESVRPGETGLLAPHGDVGAWRDAMVRLVVEPGLRARFGAAARVFAESLSWDAAARRTAEHLETTVRAGRRA